MVAYNMRLLKLYVKLQFLNIRSLLEYRIDFWIGIVGVVFRQLTAFIFISALFLNIPVIEHWNLWEVTFLYGLMTITQGLATLLFDGCWRLRGLINTGYIDSILTRPLSPLLQIISQNTGVHGFGNIGIGLFVLFYSTMQLHISWNIIHIIFLMFSLFSSVLIIGSINLITNCIGFWDPSTTATFPFVIANMSEFAKFPITLFGSSFQFIFTWVLPFAFVSYYPGLLLLNHPGVSWLSYLSPLSGWITAFIAVQLWQWALKHYQGVGH